ncbi:oxidoreductase, partial [Magnaporthiopsis poae ATCC 64411]
MADLKVLIVGCGVAGSAQAVWFARLGADVTVIERRPDLTGGGQQIDFRGPAIPLMDKMGIRDEIKAVITKEPGMQIVDTRGKTVAFFPTNQDGSSAQSFSSDYEIMRGDLVRVMCEANKGQERVRYLFDTTIESFTQDDVEDPNGKVHVCFADGRREDYDLVIGADGSGSKVRRLMLGPGVPDAVESQDFHFAFFSIASRPDDSYRWTICLRPGRAVLVSRRDRPDLLRAYFMIDGDHPTLNAAYKSGDREQLKQAWVELFRGRG